jgi:hypothetical protein
MMTPVARREAVAHREKRNKWAGKMRIDGRPLIRNLYEIGHARRDNDFCQSCLRRAMF